MSAAAQQVDKTHYRKAFNSPYLSSADVVDNIVVTIQRVVLEKDKTKRTKDSHNTAYFEEKEIRPGEPLKPMILNVANSEFLAKQTGSKFIDDWSGVTVTIYVDHNVRFGRETVEGLRLREAEQHITDEQVSALKKLIKETDSDLAKLLAYYRLSSLERTPASMFGRIKSKLEQKAS